MKGLKGVLMFLLWSCLGIATIATGGIVLVLVILAFLGKLVWTLITNSERNVTNK
jgi:hypothetical protein